MRTNSNGLSYGEALRKANTRRNAVVRAITEAHAVSDMAAATKAELALGICAGDPTSVGFSSSDLKFQAERLHGNFELSNGSDLRDVLEHKREMLAKIQERVSRDGGRITAKTMEIRTEMRKAVSEISTRIRGIRGAGIALDAELERRANPVHVSPIISRAPKPEPKPVRWRRPRWWQRSRRS